MKNYTGILKAFFFISAAAIFLVCCKTTETLVPGSSDLTVAKSRWQNTSMDDLTKGYNIYMGKCTDCHDYKEPKDYTEADWIKIMKTMGRKAKLDSTSYYQVLHYALVKRQTTLSAKK